MTEVESLRAELAHTRMLLDRFRDAERELSDAYVRLRIILCAGFTENCRGTLPVGVTSQQIWSLTEAKARLIVAKADMISE